MSTSQSPNEILESLDARQLRERLDTMDRERAALLVLLRAARARERRTQATPAGASHGG